jgi:hypothetical protein
MTDWIEHTTDTCPVDPETVVEVRLRGVYVRPADKAGDIDWGSFLKASGRPPLGSPILHPLDVTHYRIITPAPTPPLFLGDDPAKPAWLDDPDPGADPAKPPEPDMTRRYDAAEAYAERRVRPEMNADAAAALKRQLADAYRAGEAVQELKVKALAKPPEPEMAKTAQEHAAAMFATAIKPEPDLITLRLECLKMAVGMLDRLTFREGSTVADAADDLLHYVLNGSVDKA